jgi:geranylgeranyl transferase type-1 subunit beta
MLNDWSGVDQSSAVRYIKECRSWDGAIALIPGQESHGGSTFCGVASLALMGKLDEVLDGDDDDDDDDDDVTSSTGAFTYSWREELIQWCVSRQTEGIQGRPNKLEDTCYSFWIGGTLKILGCDQLLDKDALKGFIMDCQTDMGGFSKLRNGLHYCPDLLHSFYSLAWLSVGDSGSGGRDDNHDFLYPIDCVLGISRRRIDDFLERN